MGTNDFRIETLRTARHDSAAIAIVLTLHLALIIPIAWISSPNCDELAHLASGIYHWQVGKFDAYRVNPPLYRMWCTIPIALCDPQLVWQIAPHEKPFRSEWCLSAELLRATSPADLRFYLIAARLMGLPIVMVGGISSYLWAHSRYGSQAAIATLILWSFSPNVLSWGATLCPDVAATAIGILASLTLCRWLASNDWTTTVGCGILQGLCILTKLTWILLLFTTPLLIGSAVLWSGRGRRTRTGQGVVLILIGLLVVNLGYGFERALTPLSQFEFQSRLFQTMRDRVCESSKIRSVQNVPIPLPANLIIGLDQQRHDFEQGKSSYLLGKWSSRGWYQYYLVCAALKIPLGLWLMLISIPVMRRFGCDKRQPITDHLALWVPMICLAIMVSSQNGFSRHFRYIFPCLPFVFIIAGQAARVDPRVNAFRFVGVTSLVWFAFSSVSSWPLCHSYFNELAGGPRQGYRFLLDSNVDWGEDVLRAEKWLARNPMSNPVYRGFVTDEFAAHRNKRWRREPDALLPGWYLVSIHRVMDPNDRFSIMRQFRPVDRIAFSTFVYHLSTDDVRRRGVIE